MKTRIPTAFLALGILIWAACSGQAATLAAAMSVGATYDLAGNTQSATSFINDGTPHIYRIDFLTTMSGLAANESFGAQSFNLTLSGSSLSRNTVNAPGPDLLTPKPNYVPNNPTMSNIAAAGSFTPIPNFFSGGDIGDIGASTTDLQGIIAAIDNATVGNVVDATTHNPVTDPRKSIGVGSPFQLGSVYLKWNGNAAASLTMQNLQFAIVNSQTHQFGLATNLADVTLNFTPVPEPASLMLAAIGFLAMAAIGMRLR
jgi:hypothetical protein